MEKMKLNSKKIIVWLCVNYEIFVFAFFSLGLFSEKYRMVLWINFFLDVAICIISLILNIILFSTKHKNSLLVKILLLLITLFFVAFTYYAFIMPENGLTPLLFS